MLCASHTRGCFEIEQECLLFNSRQVLVSKSKRGKKLGRKKTKSSGSGVGCAVLLVIAIPIFLISSFFSWIGSLGPAETPDLIGKSVYIGQEALEKSGFSTDNVHVKSAFEGADSDSTWLVCKQSIAPKEKVDRKSTIELLAAPDCGQLDENGAVKDLKAPVLMGLTLEKAEELVQTNVGKFAKVDRVDVTPSKRSVWDSSAWIVCSQDPVAETKISPVGTMTLKYGRNDAECKTGVEWIPPKEEEPAPVVPEPAPAPPAPVVAPPAPVKDVTYGGCADVRAAGAAPIRRGDPGYSSKLDRDGDGVACE